MGTFTLLLRRREIFRKNFHQIFITEKWGGKLFSRQIIWKDFSALSILWIFIMPNPLFSSRIFYYCHRMKFRLLTKRESPQEWARKTRLLWDTLMKWKNDERKEFWWHYEDLYWKSFRQFHELTSSSFDNDVKAEWKLFPLLRSRKITFPQWDLKDFSRGGSSSNCQRKHSAMWMRNLMKLNISVLDISQHVEMQIFHLCDSKSCLSCIHYE